MSSMIEQDEWRKATEVAKEVLGAVVDARVITRWVQKGVNGAKLIAKRGSRTWFTTTHNFTDFIDRQTENVMSKYERTQESNSDSTNVSDDELRSLGLLYTPPSPPKDD